MRHWTSVLNRARRPALCAVALAAAGLWVARYVPTGTQSAQIVFAALGDTGTGLEPQYDVARAMLDARRDMPFDMVLLLGDNTYSSSSPAKLPQALEHDFERPYRQLLAAGVRFYAVLGNHDPPQQRFYPAFHMQGRRYYSFVHGPVLFVGLDTVRMDAEQTAWLDRELDRPLRWKIVYFHHPLYSAGRFHGSDPVLRQQLEPIFIRRGVGVVFTAHDHVYMRTKPQFGITYFVCGSGGRLRFGDLAPNPITAKGFDRDNAFFLGAVEGDRLRFRVVSRTGAIVDAGQILAPLLPSPPPDVWPATAIAPRRWSRSVVRRGT